MPLVFLEQLPLPSLQSYVTVSVLLFVSSALYAVNILRSNGFGDEGLQDSLNIYDIMSQASFCFWANLNMAYCCLFLFGKVIQRVVFGDLRATEMQQIRDRFWNFIFYKFIFIFGVLNVQKMNEIMWWTAWFTLLGFFHLFAQLCKDRFEYLSFSPTTHSWLHSKVIGLLVVLLFCCNGLFFLCLFVGWPDGVHTFTFMLAECILLLLKILHVQIRYGIHLWDIGHAGTWESCTTWSYYTDFFLDLGMSSVDFCHQLHMLLSSNIFLSMASLVLCMQLRHLFREIKKKLAKHRNYIRIIKCIETRFAMATIEELTRNDDDCAICWDALHSARKLSCGHLFHGSCLRSWLENDTSCPTCRQSLASELQPEADAEERTPRGMAAFVMGRGIRRNHFFHFDGSQIASWFPSFSVEVLHTRADNAEEGQLTESRIEAMTHQVQAMFPHVPFNIIAGDLRQTHSVEVTTDNILEGHVAVPSVWTPPEEQPVTEEASLLQLPEMNEEADESDSSSEEHDSSRSPTGGHGEDTPAALGSHTPQNEGTSVEGEVSEEQKQNASATTMQQQITLPSVQFSEEPTARQSSLQRRKEVLLQQARRRFLANAPDSRTEEKYACKRTGANH